MLYHLLKTSIVSCSAALQQTPVLLLVKETAIPATLALATRVAFVSVAVATPAMWVQVLDNITAVLACSNVTMSSCIVLHIRDGFVD